PTGPPRQASSSVAALSSEASKAASSLSDMRGLSCDRNHAARAFFRRQFADRALYLGDRAHASIIAGFLCQGNRPAVAGSRATAWRAEGRGSMVTEYVFS